MAPGVGVTSQAGVGGTQAYGRIGVLELGGSGGLTLTKRFNQIELSPSAGLFIADNSQISLLGVYSRYHAKSVNATSTTSATDASTTTVFKLLIEPSYHLPLSDTMFAFFGLGAGVAYLSGQDVGFALQPRLGMNFLVGRSGVLSPSLNVAYSTVDAVNTPSGTVLGIQTSYGINVGYTVMY